MLCRSALIQTVGTYFIFVNAQSKLLITNEVQELNIVLNVVWVYMLITRYILSGCNSNLDKEFMIV